MNYGQKKTFILNFHLIYCINHRILPKNDYTFAKICII